ncbi:hypothetical protein ACWIGX_26785, partial [Streptomyces nigrescens]
MRRAVRRRLLHPETVSRARWGLRAGAGSPRRRPHLSRSRRGERVRIVDIGDFSQELCGGTHVARCSQVGAFRLRTELSIGSNLCRVEALTGHSTLTHLDTERRLL